MSGETLRVFDIVRDTLKNSRDLRDQYIDQNGHPVTIYRATKIKRTDWGEETVQETELLKTYILFKFNEWLEAFADCDFSIEQAPPLEATIKVSDPLQRGDVVKITGETPQEISRIKSWKITAVSLDQDATKVHGRKIQLAPDRGGVI